MIPIKVNNINSFRLFQLLKYTGQLFINIALAKSQLSNNEIGQFEYFNFVASGFSFFWIIGIMQALLSIYHDQDDTKNNAIFFNTTLYILSFSIASLLFVSVYLNFTNDIITTSQISILYIYVLINPIGYLIEYILLLTKGFRILIYFGLTTFVIPLLLIASPLLFGMGFIYVLWGLLLWSAIKLIYLAVLIAKYSVLQLNTMYLRKLIKHSMPLIITALVSGSAAYIDGYIISRYYDAETFAVFRYGAKEFPLFLIIASAFSTSVIPEVAKKGNLQTALKQIKVNSRKMILFMFPIAIVLLISSKFLFPLVFSNSFKASYTIFNVYLLLIISRFIFANSILMGLRENKIILLISCAELLINVTLSIVLLQYFGYLGVAYGTFIAYLFEKIALIIVLRKRKEIKVSEYLPVKLLLFFSITMLIIYVNTPLN